MHLTPMPSALLARRLRSRLWCQKQVGASDRGRSAKKTLLYCESTVDFYMNTTITLEGYLIFIFIGGDSEGSSQRFPISKAIFRNNKEITIDCNCALPGDPPWVYTIQLTRESTLMFRGHWTNPERTTGECSCRFYATDERIALIGMWKEDSGTQQWIAELAPE